MMTDSREVSVGPGNTPNPVRASPSDAPVSAEVDKTAEFAVPYDRPRLHLSWRVTSVEHPVAIALARELSRFETAVTAVTAARPNSGILPVGAFLAGLGATGALGLALVPYLFSAPSWYRPLLSNVAAFAALILGVLTYSLWRELARERRRSVAIKVVLRTGEDLRRAAEEVFEALAAQERGYEQ